MQHLDISLFENSVPEWFVDWIKAWDVRNDITNKKVQKLLSWNQLEEALQIHYETLFKWIDFSWYTHKWNDRIH
jgi:hypothetical protein